MIPRPFLVVLVFWLTVLFVSFGLFAPCNATVALITPEVDADTATTAGELRVRFDPSDGFRRFVAILR